MMRFFFHNPQSMSMADLIQSSPRVLPSEDDPFSSPLEGAGSIESAEHGEDTGDAVDVAVEVALPLDTVPDVKQGSTAGPARNVPASKQSTSLVPGLAVSNHIDSPKSPHTTFFQCPFCRSVFSGEVTERLRSCPVCKELITLSISEAEGRGLHSNSERPGSTRRHEGVCRLPKSGHVPPPSPKYRTRVHPGHGSEDRFGRGSAPFAKAGLGSSRHWWPWFTVGLRLAVAAVLLLLLLKAFAGVFAIACLTRDFSPGFTSPTLLSQYSIVERSDL